MTSPTTNLESTFRKRENTSVEAPPPKRPCTRSDAKELSPTAFPASLLQVEESASQQALQRSLNTVQALPIENESLEAELKTLIQKGDCDAVRNLLESSPQAVQALRINSLGYIHLALKSAHTEMSSLLAVQCGMQSMLNHASRKGKEKSTTPLSLESLFELAVENGAWATTEVLATYGVNPKRLCPLALAHLGLIKKDTSLIARAYEKGLPCNTEHPLHILAFACTKGVHALMKPPENELTPLHAAAKLGSLPVALLLLDWGADITSRTAKGLTPFLLACQAGHKDCALGLLARGATLDEKSTGWPKGDTALHLACMSGNKELVSALLDTHQLPLDSMGSRKQTPLQVACLSGHKELAIMLIQMGASLQTREDSALPYACSSGNVELVKELIDTFKCQIEERVNYKMTALEAACNAGQINVVEFLLERGASLTNNNAHGQTPLHHACESGNTELVARLIEKYKYPVNARDYGDLTPLHHAIRYSIIEVIQTLLEHGADVHTQDEYGNSPLSEAYDRNNKELLRELIRHGVDPSKTTSCNSSLVIETFNTYASDLGHALYKQPPSVRNRWLYYTLPCQGHLPLPLLYTLPRAFWEAFSENNESYAAIFKLFPQAIYALPFPLWLAENWQLLAHNAADKADILMLKHIHNCLIFFADASKPFRELTSEFRFKNISMSTLLPTFGTCALHSLLKINTLYYRTILKEEVELPAAPQQPLEKLEEYANTLNINEPDAPAYIPLRRLIYNRNLVSKDALIRNITTQLNYLRSNEFYTGAPALPEARKIFYNTIALQLRAAADAVEKESDPTLLAQKRAKCAMVLGFAGFACAAQLKSAARDLFFEFALNKKVTFKELLDQQIVLLSELAFREMLPDNDVHTFNRYLHTIGEFRPIPGTRFNDPHGPQNLSQRVLLNNFDSRMKPQRLFAWITDAITHNTDGIRDMYLEDAKHHISSHDLAEIDRVLEKRLAKKAPGITLAELLANNPKSTEELTYLSQIGVAVGPSYEKSIDTWEQLHEKLPNAVEIKAQATELRSILASFSGKPERELLAALREAGMSHLQPASFTTALQEARERIYIEKKLYTSDHKLDEVKILSHLYQLKLFTENY